MNCSTPCFPISWSSLKLMSIKSVMSSGHLILCRPRLLLPPIPPSIRVFSSESMTRASPVSQTMPGSLPPFHYHPISLSVQFSSVNQSCPTLSDPMNCSTPGLPVHHQLPEFTQTHVHRVSDAIQPSHPLSSPSPPAPNPSQHQSLFQ